MCMCTLARYAFRKIKCKTTTIEAIHVLAVFVIVTILFCEFFLKDYARSHWKSPTVELNLNHSQHLAYFDSSEFPSLYYRWVSSNSQDQQPSYKVTGTSVQIMPDVNDTQLNASAFTGDVNKKNTNISKIEIYNEHRNKSSQVQTNNVTRSLTSDSNFPQTQVIEKNKKNETVLEKDEDDGRKQKIASESSTVPSDNHEYLIFMLHRLFKMYNIKRVIDPNCNPPNQAWLPALLQKVEFDIPSFQYICIISDSNVLLNKKKLSEILQNYSTTFDQLQIIKHKISNAYHLEQLNMSNLRADAGLLWNSVGFWPPPLTWDMIQLLQTSSPNVRFVFIPNYPGIVDNDLKQNTHGKVNVRRVPYQFTTPLRIINNMSLDSSLPKQLLVYNVSDNI